MRFLWSKVRKTSMYSARRPRPPTKLKSCRHPSAYVVIAFARPCAVCGTFATGILVAQSTSGSSQQQNSASKEVVVLERPGVDLSSGTRRQLAQLRNLQG